MTTQTETPTRRWAAQTMAAMAKGAVLHHGHRHADGRPTHERVGELHYYLSLNGRTYFVPWEVAGLVVGAEGVVPGPESDGVCYVYRAGRKVA